MNAQYRVGERVEVRNAAGRTHATEWLPGVVTDVFQGSVSGRLLYAVKRDVDVSPFSESGYYAHEVRPLPESLRVTA